MTITYFRFPSTEKLLRLRLSDYCSQPVSPSVGRCRSHLTVANFSTTGHTHICNNIFIDGRNNIMISNSFWELALIDTLLSITNMLDLHVEEQGKPSNTNSAVFFNIGRWWWWWFLIGFGFTISWLTTNVLIRRLTIVSWKPARHTECRTFSS